MMESDVQQWVGFRFVRREESNAKVGFCGDAPIEKVKGIEILTMKKPRDSNGSNRHRFMAHSRGRNLDSCSQPYETLRTHEDVNRSLFKSRPGALRLGRPSQPERNVHLKVLASSAREREKMRSQMAKNRTGGGELSPPTYGLISFSWNDH
jgi:hypothetical protein